MTALTAPLRLGTRASPLAVAQANLAKNALMAAHGLTAQDIEIVTVQTVGDKVLDRPLAEIGGKALWTKELDRALLQDEIDFAVHSMKDVETFICQGIIFASVLERADPRDRLIGISSLSELPKGAIVGTSSPRRVAQLLHRRPDVQTISLRGNVASRMRQIDEGKAHATFLAAAGLDRLNVDAGHVLDIADWLPAASQGIVGMTCREGDLRVASLLANVCHATTMMAAKAERAVLEGLGGSCHTAVAVHCRVETTHVMHMRAELFSPDGQECVAESISGDGDPRELGLQLAQRLLSRASQVILDTLEAPQSASVTSPRLVGEG